MWPESSEQKQELRSGLTTGCCATACCVAAAQALLANKQPDKVEVLLPRGQLVELSIENYQILPVEHECTFEQVSTSKYESTSKHECTSDQAEQPPLGMRTATIKDAGDDPDVTHGATVFVELRLVDEPGVIFKPAEGVGTVTREGLVLEVGEAAINPVPRKMMSEHLLNAANVYGYLGGFEVSVGVEKGEQIALKTMNPRLGILGGLSILGTTGIVRPYSCAAYIASIRQGVDVARSNGISHIAATTGSTSEAAIQAHYQLDEMALIEMGDFMGALLKHLKKAPVGKLSICGGFGKMSKLANGHMDLNSRSSSIDFKHLSEMAIAVGADNVLVDKILQANTSMEVLKLCTQQQLDLAKEVCSRALHEAQNMLKVAQPDIEIEVWATDRKGQFVGHAESECSSRESSSRENSSKESSS